MNRKMLPTGAVSMRTEHAFDFTGGHVPGTYEVETRIIMDGGGLHPLDSMYGSTEVVDDEAAAMAVASRKEADFAEDGVDWDGEGFFISISVWHWITETARKRLSTVELAPVAC
jgi:hypothetical protein